MAEPRDLSKNGEDTPTRDTIASAIASHRFFFSSPGPSNSIIDYSSSSSSSSSSCAAPNDAVLRGGCVAVPTYSPDPYTDFRRSMQEMVDEIKGGEIKLDYLHQLLMCYLSLNTKNTHKFILAAFADLLVSLTPPPPPQHFASNNSPFSSHSHRKVPIGNPASTNCSCSVGASSHSQTQ